MIQNIRLQNFRSYKNESFEFENGVNIIVGPNASGKTNLLEAINFIAVGRSFKSGDTEAIAHNKPWARLEAKLQKGTRVAKLAQKDSQQKKEFEINTKKIGRLSAAQTLPAVVFEPRHLLLLNKDPGLRRDYLDGLLEQTVAEYRSVRKKYIRALAQRNALLKSGYRAARQLFAWDIRLSELGSTIAVERFGLSLKINQLLPGLYSGLAGSKKKQISAQYLPGCDIKNYSSQMLRQLEARQKQDIDRGFTSIGPQREDLSIKLDGLPSSQVASRGETRTILLCLKIIESTILEEKRGIPPILLLDDVFSELDGYRRRALTKAINNQQTFITTTDADIVVEHFMNSCRVIPLQGLS